MPGALSTLGASAWAVNPASSPSSDWADYPWDRPNTLLAASPHSETTLAILGKTGVAIAVMTDCLAAMEAFPRMCRPAGPVIAVGSMARTYCSASSWPPPSRCSGRDFSHAARWSG